MVAVMVLGYKRPENLRAVLASVSRASPSFLHVVIDGPREGDEAAVAATRSVVREFEWDCEVQCDYLSENLGVRRAMTAALDKFFTSQSFGVVLEDDCYPAPDFFRFMKAASERFAGEERVGMVSGTNFLEKVERPTDVLFTEGHIWGWATWADRWFAYRADPSFDPRNARRYYGEGWPYRRMLIRKTEAGELDSWAIPWLYHLASRGLLSVTPRVNLVTNIGHGSDGTHTSGGSRYANLQLFALPPVIRMDGSVRMDRGYRRRYAVGLTVEHLVHTARRPLVAAIRGAIRRVGSIREGGGGA